MSEVFSGVEVSRQVLHSCVEYSVGGPACWFKRRLLELQGSWVASCSREGLAPLVVWWRLIVEAAYRMYEYEGGNHEEDPNAEVSLQTPADRVKHKHTFLRQCCEEAVGNPAVTNLLLEQMHLAHLQQQYQSLKPGAERGEELEVYERCDLIAWRQHDLRHISLQRRCSATMSHDVQTVSWPEDE